MSLYRSARSGLLSEEIMLTTVISKTTKGEYIKRTESAKAVYVRGEYVRSKNAFACYAFDDICKIIYINVDKEVFVDFEF